MTVDPRARSGFGSSAGAYERGRPPYPAAAVEEVARALGVGKAGTVLDLAAGTGKLTRVLAPLAGRVVAVDPSEGMLAELRRLLPEVVVLEGTAESIPTEDAAFDAVFVGEAFHWFQVDAACREIARVLRPSGGLALLWNRPHWSMPWLEQFDELMKPYLEAAGPFPAGGDSWRESLEQCGLFSPLRHREVEHTQHLAPDDFIVFISSWSWVANLAEEERTSLLEEVRALIGEDELALDYRTQIFCARRSAAGPADRARPA